MYQFIGSCAVAIFTLIITETCKKTSCLWALFTLAYKINVSPWLLAFSRWVRQGHVGEIFMLQHLGWMHHYQILQSMERCRASLRIREQSCGQCEARDKSRMHNVSTGRTSVLTIRPWGPVFVFTAFRYCSAASLISGGFINNIGTHVAHVCWTVCVCVCARARERWLLLSGAWVYIQSS